MSEINYGPLKQLIGTWTGDKGMDIAPEPKGQEDSEYFETITFEAIGDVSNAGAQTLSVLHYKQVVSRKASGDVFHHQCGYWTWDSATGVITHSYSIPRGVSVVASGKVIDSDEEPEGTLIQVSAEETGFDGGIAQSTFMQRNANTNAFFQTFKVDGDKLKYSQTMMLDIYQKTFEHTDSNTLVRKA
ncbi:MAG: heme-binding beta-barrel domain-containing protein [Ghiorsea sp.]